MNRSKKNFITIAVAFLLLLAYASYDIAKRTTFPGSKPQLQERIKQQFGAVDTLKTDSLETGQ
jgi:hypothetical protein